MDRNKQTKNICVPDIAGTISVAEILIKTSEHVSKDQPLAVLESDKAALELTASCPGQITAIHVSQGEEVTAGQQFCEILLTDQSEKAKELQCTFPDLGSQTSQVVEVHKSPGDHVDKNEAICTCESEKAVMEVPAPQAGKLIEVFIQVGDQATAGQPMCSIESDQVTESPAKKIPQKAVDQSIAKEMPQKAVDQSIDLGKQKRYKQVAAGPAVRHLATEFGIDLNEVAGSGYKGRITSTDLKSYNRQRLSSTTAKLSPPSIDFSRWGAVRHEKLHRIRRASAEHLTMCATIPQVTQFFECDLTVLEAFRKECKKEIKQIRVTPLIFFIKALSAVCQKYPRFNASLSADGHELILKEYFNVGIAIDTPDGLVVGVIHNIAELSLWQLADHIQNLSHQAREKGLTPQQMQGGCMTLSSLGGIGGQYFTPIVNVPEVAILGIGKAEHKPVLQEGQWVPRYMVPMALSYDHRVIDGADAARFVVAMTEEINSMSASCTLASFKEGKNG